MLINIDSLYRNIVKIPKIDILSVVLGAGIFYIVDRFIVKEALVGETMNTLNYTGEPGRYDLS